MNDFVFCHLFSPFSYDIGTSIQKLAPAKIYQWLIESQNPLNSHQISPAFDESAHFYKMTRNDVQTYVLYHILYKSMK